MFKSFKKIFLRFKAQSNKKRLFLINLLGFVLVAGGLLTWGLTRYSADTNNPTSLEQLQTAPKPNFKPGHTLPRLSYWLASDMAFDVMRELTENWDYGLSYPIRAETIGSPMLNKIRNLALSDPDRYPITFLTPHRWTNVTEWSSSADVPVNTLRRHLAITYICLTASGSKDHIPGVVGSEAWWRAATKEEVPDNYTDSLPENAWTHIDNPGTFRNRARPLWSMYRDATVGVIKQYSVDGHSNAKFYICLTALGSKDHAPGAVGSETWWREATIAELDASPGLQIWSPEAPTSIFEDTATYWAGIISDFHNANPTIKLPILFNGAEYGIGAIGWDTVLKAAPWPQWQQDPVIWQAVGQVPMGTANRPVWYNYISEQKNRQEQPIAAAFRAIDPNDQYIIYSNSGAMNRSLTDNSWMDYSFGYTQRKDTTDLPSGESYYGYHSTWLDTNGHNLWRLSTNEIAQQVAAGNALSYNFVSAGWLEWQGNLVNGIDATTTSGIISSANWGAKLAPSGTIQIDNEIISYTSKPTPTTLGGVVRGVAGTDGVVTTATAHNAGSHIMGIYVADQASYMGFLKMKYAMGMIGGNVFYFDPTPTDPNWLWQMQSLSHVHALYSWLEDYERSGNLLVGNGNHYFSTDLPSYEYINTATDVTAHVVARKKTASNDWLIAAWAQDGTDREVTVTIPVLGTVTINARVAGSVYTAKLDSEGKPVLTLMDVDAMNPTDGISGRVDDGANPPAPIANLNKTFTYKSKMTISGTKSAKVKKVSVNQKEAQVDNNANTWSIVLDLVNGQNTLTILGQDDASKSSSTTTRTITRRKVGDFNNDSKIDGSDFTLLLFNWGSLLSNNFGDFNEDGKVDGSDFTIMLYWWGK